MGAPLYCGGGGGGGWGGGGWNATAGIPFAAQGFSLPNNTVNSSMFARDLFGDFRDHIKITKINTRKHNSGS